MIFFLTIAALFTETCIVKNGAMLKTILFLPAWEDFIETVAVYYLTYLFIVITFCFRLKVVVKFAYKS